LPWEVADFAWLILMDSVSIGTHAGDMLHDVLICVSLILGLVALDFAALRWGEDTRTPTLLRQARWPQT
jgi:hypothetical protein